MASSASRLYHQLTSSVFLRNRTSSLTVSTARRILLTSSHSTRIAPPLRFYSGGSSGSLVADEDGADLSPASAAATAHPWPEWGQFVDKMRSKGYFVKKQPDETAGAGDVASDASSASYSSASMELNAVKNACLSFARERYDILRSLPQDDIRAIVECGCPNLLRKAVNSAKRLRAFLRLDEGDVCSACKLRGSCDKAYVVESGEGQARTVDVIRILMSYAVDPTLKSGGTNPLITEKVHDSARKLLGDLIRLSDTTIDPALPKPEVISISKKETLKNPAKVVSTRNNSRDVEMKRGDWICSNCNYLNFARNVRCLECKADGPKRVEFTPTEMKKGDWTCPKCDFMNFSRNKQCFRCNELRPKRELTPGEWECPKCDFLNFSRNGVCKKCNCARPADGTASGFGDHGHTWRKPRMARDAGKFLGFGDDEDDFEELDQEGDRRVERRESSTRK